MVIIILLLLVAVARRHPLNLIFQEIKTSARAYARERQCSPSTLRCCDAAQEVRALPHNGSRRVPAKTSLRSISGREYNPRRQPTILFNVSPETFLSCHNRHRDLRMRSEVPSQVTFVPAGLERSQSFDALSSYPL